MSPIEELTYPVQMEKLEPWIKQIYGQAKLTTGTFEKPLKADSQYNNKKEHQPISDWSAKVNKEYYDNILDLEFDWGRFNQPTYGSDDIKPIRYPPKKPRKLTEEEKRFVLLCNTVLGLELTEEEFLRISSVDKQELYDRVVGL